MQSNNIEHVITENYDVHFISIYFIFMSNVLSALSILTTIRTLVYFLVEFNGKPILIILTLLSLLLNYMSLSLFYTSKEIYIITVSFVLGVLVCRMIKMRNKYDLYFLILLILCFFSIVYGLCLLHYEFKSLSLISSNSNLIYLLVYININLLLLPFIVILMKYF